MAAGAARAGGTESDEDEVRRREAARALFNEGLEYSDVGRWQEAADRFQRAYDLRASAEIGYNLAQAHVRLGHLALATELLRRAAVDPEASPAARAAARVRLGQVAPRLGRLKVQVAPAPGGPGSAFLDGRELESSMLGVTLPVDPGPHLIQARWHDGRDLSRRVTLAEGAESTVTLGPPAPAAAVATGSAAASGESRPSIFRRGWFWLAVAGVAAGTAVALSVPHLRGGAPSGNVDTWQVGQ
jgi:hypothetical protein